MSFSNTSSGNLQPTSSALVPLNNQLTIASNAPSSTNSALTRYAGIGGWSCSSFSSDGSLQISWRDSATGGSIDGLQIKASPYRRFNVDVRPHGDLTSLDAGRPIRIRTDLLLDLAQSDAGTTFPVSAICHNRASDGRRSEEMRMATLADITLVPTPSGLWVSPKPHNSLGIAPGMYPLRPVASESWHIVPSVDSSITLDGEWKPVGLIWTEHPNGAGTSIEDYCSDVIGMGFEAWLQRLPR